MTPRIPILYLAPWIDYGGSDKGTIDWFRFLDRERFAPYLATTQESLNRRLAEVTPYAEEIWPLPDLVDGQAMPELLFDLIATRGIEVVHLMNSRVGYELLPDLASLPHPPKVVVQLHVEEQDRSGYVRLVSRRYGNLVDAFSVSSEHLADAVEGYDVPRSKIHVILTGVDAREEFSPGSAVVAGALAGEGTHVLYPGRLVDQKDPLLMVEVAALAVQEQPDLRFHVVGDGPLEDDVRKAIAEHRLESNVVLHPPTRELAGWYAGSDLLLMTSVFEGVPYTLYESMAMELPVVAPSLPGNVELLADGGGVLIERRDDAGAYAAAVAELARDSERRRALGRSARERALGEFSLEAMARAHEGLYDSLLDGERSPGPPLPAPEPARTPTLTFSRERRGTPLVSVIVPCFNHGRFLGECLDAIEAQTWPALEVFVVDDASPDGFTRQVLDEIEAAGRATVIRMPERGGPSKARNAALERIRGRYVLPVDADNILLADAVERLVGQLRDAGETTGFVYPNLQFFGNRRDYFEAPEYNAFWLLEGNYCDTCSLFDADIFHAGVRFDSSILLGHEDWELTLDLAGRGVRGEPARFPTLLYRKSGFNRSDAVEHAPEHFSDVVLKAHPEFYGDDAHFGRFGWHSGPAVSIKARWRPGLSLIALEPVRDAALLRERLSGPGYADVELLVRSDEQLEDLPAGPHLRRIPAALAVSAAAALDDGLKAARSDLVLVTAGAPEELLADPALIEKLLRARLARPEAGTIVLHDAGADGRYPLRLLGPGDELGTAHAILFTRTEVPALVDCDHVAPIESLALTFSMLAPLQWRHHPALVKPEPAGKGTKGVVLAGGGRATAAAAEADRRFARVPALPSTRGGIVRRWTFGDGWVPPLTKPLVRHRALEGEDRVTTNDHRPPPGFVPEQLLGLVQIFQAPGTAELRADGPEGFVVLGDADEGEPMLRGPKHPAELGFLEEAPLPGVRGLEAGYFAHNDQWVLIGPDDPMVDHVERRRFLGFVEPFPRDPVYAPLERRPYGLLPLVRSVDRGARRHRYATDAAGGAPVLELGALHTTPVEGSVALWLTDGVPQTADVRPGAPAAEPRDRARWAVAPMTWRGAGALKFRLRSVARRATIAARPRTRSLPAPAGKPLGYLWPEPGPGMRALYAAVHPVTADVLLTPWPLEAADLGYGEAQLLGYTSTLVSATGSFDPPNVDVPWASRFGRRVRRG